MLPRLGRPWTPGGEGGSDSVLGVTMDLLATFLWNVYDDLSRLFERA